MNDSCLWNVSRLVYHLERYDTQDLRDIHSTLLSVLLSHHPTKSLLYFHVLDALSSSMIMCKVTSNNVAKVRS